MICKNYAHRLHLPVSLQKPTLAAFGALTNNVYPHVEDAAFFTTFAGPKWALQVKGLGTSAPMQAQQGFHGRRTDNQILSIK